jgi:cbb3-type cytochrome oxidase subunit 3
MLLWAVVSKKKQTNHTGMKYINYLKTIADIDIFPIIGLVLFVGFFVGMSFYVFGADKKVMQQHGGMPLDS